MPDRMSPDDFTVLLSDDPVESMEAAKRLISQEIDVEGTKRLCDIIQDRHAPPHVRVTAVYLLGFTDPEIITEADKQVVRDILADTTEPVSLREHAAEALGNMHDEAALDLLFRMTADPAMEVKDSAYYACAEIQDYPECPVTSSLDGQVAAEALPEPHSVEPVAQHRDARADDDDNNHEKTES